MEQLSIEDWKPDACPKNITVEEYLATFPKIKLTRREYLQTIPLYLVSCGFVPCRDNPKSTQFTGMVSVFKRKSRSKRGGVIW